MQLIQSSNFRIALRAFAAVICSVAPYVHQTYKLHRAQGFISLDTAPLRSMFGPKCDEQQFVNRAHST